MHKTINPWKCSKFLIGITFFLVVFLFQEASCRAEVLYQNPETNFQVLIEDDAELLSHSEITALTETMKPITEYGNVAFKSVSCNSMDTDDFARSFYKGKFGKSSGTVFVIDMDNRNIWIFSDGKVYRTITKSYANTITDNVYRKASAAQYFACANEAFTQINTLLEGSHIMQPMKYISNALLAVILALLINFTYICFFSRLKQPTSKEIFKALDSHFEYSTPTATLTHQTRTYSPQSSDSGGSSSRGGSSGGGGGSSSGGGGGHSF